MLGRLIVSTALLMGIAQAQAAPYSFRVIADDLGFTAPALNDSGTVAQGMGMGVSQRFDMWPRGGSASTMIDTAGAFASFTTLSPIPLNNNGTIAFRGTLDSGVEGIYTFGPAGLRTIADTTDRFSGFGAPPSLPALDDFGRVAFTADLRGGGSGVFVGDGATTTALATTAGGVFAGFPGLALEINSRGDAAFVGNLAAGGQAVLLGIGGAPATPIVDTTGPFSGFGAFVSLNDEGAVAFSAMLDAGGQGVYVWDDGVLTPIMLTSGPITVVGNQSLNDRGALSILTNQSGAQHAIHLYTPDEGLHRLIGAGDSLFGSTVVATGQPNRGVFTSTNSLNNLDELAFLAVLADGRRLIVLASPVPEPVTASLVILGLAAAGALRGKRAARPA